MSNEIDNSKIEIVYLKNSIENILARTAEIQTTLKEFGSNMKDNNMQILTNQNDISHFKEKLLDLEKDILKINTKFDEKDKESKNRNWQIVVILITAIVGVVVSFLK